MKIFSLCLVKNEADIIEQTLRAAASWSDSIYVVDNGSDDGTWEKIQDIAGCLQNIIPFKQDSRLYDEALREETLREYADAAQLGDWWCILDADELYIDNPKEFLPKVSNKFKSVWMQGYNYLFTDKDYERYQRDPRLYESHVPIQQRSRYYVVADYSPMRFFRHSRALRKIPTKGPYPVFPERIRVKHFMYRSPDQIRRRLDTRREAMKHGHFVHEKRASWVPGGITVAGPAGDDEIPQCWKERIVSSSGCYYDAGDREPNEAAPWGPPDGPTWAERLQTSFRKVLRRSRRLIGRRPEPSGVPGRTTGRQAPEHPG